MKGVEVRENRIAELSPCIETEIHLYKGIFIRSL